MANEGAAALIGVGAGGLFAYILSQTGKAKAAPPPGVDQDTWNLLLAMIEGQAAQIEMMDQLINSVNNLVSVLGVSPGVGADPFANTDRFTVGQVICTIALRGFRLPPIPIPKNKQLVVKAMPGNVGWIWVANVQSDSQNILIAYPLVPNEGIGYLINNADAVWVMAPTLNDGVAFTVENA